MRLLQKRTWPVCPEVKSYSRSRSQYTGPVPVPYSHKYCTVPNMAEFAHGITEDVLHTSGWYLGRSGCLLTGVIPCIWIHYYNSSELSSPHSTKIEISHSLFDILDHGKKESVPDTIFQISDNDPKLRFENIDEKNRDPKCSVIFNLESLCNQSIAFFIFDIRDIPNVSF